jgi:hypothetical protein
MKDLNDISSNILAPILIVFGIIGNIFGLIVTSKKQLKKIGPQLAYIALFIFDFINLLTFFKFYLEFAFKIDFTVDSSFACKSYWYIQYSFATTSPMMQVIISIERFILIAYPIRKQFLIKTRIQLAYIFAITLFNLLLYIPVGIYFDLINDDEKNETVCNFVDSYWQTTIGYIDLVNRLIVPFLLMIIFSILIIITIFKSRRRMNNRDNKILSKDVRFAITSITLNIFYILFSLPISIIFFLPQYWLNPFYVFVFIVFFLAYSINFYLIFLTNRLFRKGFYSIFKSCNCSDKNKNNNINTGTTRGGGGNITEMIVVKKKNVE